MKIDNLYGPAAASDSVCVAVYKAVNVRTGALVAVKAIGADKISQQKILQSLQSEINILRAVVHPNIVKLLDYQRREVPSPSTDVLTATDLESLRNCSHQLWNWDRCLVPCYCLPRSWLLVIG
jgi:serine/threonine protein kinase